MLVMLAGCSGAGPSGRVPTPAAATGDAAAQVGSSASKVPSERRSLSSRATRPAPVEERLDFAAAMERLPGGARQVFVLHDGGGYKHEEIAGMLGVSVGTSKAQLHRARMALRRHLAR